MISGCLKVSLSPRTNYFYLWRPQDTSNNSRNSQIDFVFYEFTSVETDKFEHVGKGGPMMKIRLILLENLEDGTNILKMGKHEMNIW